MDKNKNSKELFLTKDGFTYEEITFHFDEDGVREYIWGDATIITPKGEKIGVDWEISGEPYAFIPDDAKENNILFMHLGFTKKIKNIDDLVFNFHSVLPFVKELYFEKPKN